MIQETLQKVTKQKEEAEKKDENPLEVMVN